LGIKGSIAEVKLLLNGGKRFGAPLPRCRWIERTIIAGVCQCTGQKQHEKEAESLTELSANVRCEHAGMIQFAAGMERSISDARRETNVGTTICLAERYRGT